MGRIKRGEGDGLYCLHYTSQLSLQAHLVLEEAVLECIADAACLGYNAQRRKNSGCKQCCRVKATFDVEHTLITWRL